MTGSHPGHTGPAQSMARAGESPKAAGIAQPSPKAESPVLQLGLRCRGARRCSSSATWWEAVPCTAESLPQLRDPTAPARHHPEHSRIQRPLTVLVAGDWDVVDSA